MRNLKRALSLALASVMLLGMMVVGTGASYADVDSADNVEAIEVIQAIGVMTGDTNGNFNPDQKVTRGEMAVVISNLLGYKATDFAGTKLPFTDVPDWANGFVAACYADGITAGISATEYGFNYEVTTAQAALMMMKALGYFQYASDFGSDWQVATVKQGTKINLFDGITASATTAMTRNDVAQIALNTLKADVVEAEGNDGISIGDVTIGSSIKYVPLQVTCADGGYADVIGADFNAGKCTVQLGEQLYKGDLVLTTGQAADFGFTGNKWEYGTGSDKEIGTYSTAKVVASYTNASEVTFGDLYKLGEWTSAAITIQENGNAASGKVKFDTSDGNSSSLTWKGSTTKVGAFANYDGAIVNIVDQNDDGTIDAVLVQYGLLAKVDKVTAATASADRKIDLTVYSKTSNADINGYACKDFAEDDYVIVYLNKTTATANAAAAADVIKVEAAQSVTGKVTAYTGSDATASNVTSLSIAGTKYSTADGTELMLKYSTPSVNNTEYVAYLLNGYIIGLEGKAATADLGDIVYSTSDAYSSVNTNGDLLWYIKVVDMNGVSKVLSTKASLSGLNDDTFFVVGSNSNGDLTLTAAGSGQKIDNNISELDSTTTVAIDVLKDASVAFKPDTKIITLKNGSTDTKAYVDANTTYIFENGEKSTAVSGGITKTIANTAKVLVVKDANGEPYVPVILVANSSYSATVSSDILYLASGTATGGGHDGTSQFYTYEAYNLKGEKFTFNSKSTNLTSNAGKFCSFEADADGYYTLSNLSDTDYAYYYTKATNNGAAIKFTKLGTALSFTKDASGSVTSIVDAEAANAVFVNTISGTGSDVDTLTELVDQTVVSSFEGAILLDKDNNVRMIVVTDTDAA